MLAKNRFDALDRIQELKHALVGSPAAAELEEAERFAAEFRFELAQEKLRHMASENGWIDKS